MDKAYIKSINLWTKYMVDNLDFVSMDADWEDLFVTILSSFGINQENSQKIFREVDRKELDRYGVDKLEEVGYNFYIGDWSAFLCDRVCEYSDNWTLDKVMFCLWVYYKWKNSTGVE